MPHALGNGSRPCSPLSQRRDHARLPQGRSWLRTGDLGRLDADGFLYVVDRKKDMNLSGGQNIYPADIEAVIREHPAIRDVAVVGVTSDRWGQLAARFGAESLRYAVLCGRSFYLLSATLFALSARRLERDWE